MMDPLKNIRTQIELHSVEGIKKCFSEGISPNTILNDEPLIYELTGEYTRSPKFKDCVKAFVEYGLEFNDKALLSVLLDDPVALEEMIRADPGLIYSRYSIRCAYTPIEGGTYLHICAEYNLPDCARLLLEYGADVNARAGVDKYGFGGQTPIFHTVNQNQHASAQMLELLLEFAADLAITVNGLIWGKGYDWETLIPSVDPVSYAMMGLLPQMHRDEKTISEVVVKLLKKRDGIDYQPANVPNRYLGKQ